MAENNPAQIIQNAVTDGERVRTGRGRLSTQELRAAAESAGAKVRFLHKTKTPQLGWVSTWRVWL